MSENPPYPSYAQGENPTPSPGVALLAEAARRAGVTEPAGRLAAEFRLDLADIAAGRYAAEQLTDAIATLARIRGWRSGQ